MDLVFLKETGRLLEISGVLGDISRDRFGEAIGVGNSGKSSGFPKSG